MREPSDESLMGRARHGDRDAFAILVHRHIDGLYGYALRLCRCPSAAEDLVQETWLSAWRHAGRYQPRKGRPTTWLYRILHNRYIDTSRRKSPEADQQFIELAASAEIDVQYSADRDLQSALKGLLDGLPDNQRAAVALAYIRGFSIKEVAHIMGLSRRATESLLSRARKTLKAQMRPTTAIKTP